MEHDFRYARQGAFARLRATVAHCQGGPDHDGGVYLHYCEGCRGIIDSRESRFSHAQRYVCIRCGWGHATMPVGSVCPSCDTPHQMAPVPGNPNVWQCRACTHRIRPRYGATKHDSREPWTPPGGWAPDHEPIEAIRPLEPFDRAGVGAWAPARPVVAQAPPVVPQAPPDPWDDVPF